MGSTTVEAVAPATLVTLYEARWVAELLKYFAFAEKQLIAEAPPGDRRPILVIPGFLCSDISTWPLRRFLRKIGYRSFAWKQGINWGPRPGVRTRLLHRVNELRCRYGQPVTLIGWSLGGVYAREISRIRPDLVREVITLGTPLQGTPQATAVWKAFEWLNREYMKTMMAGIRDFTLPVTTPALSIFTREDGIVPWRFCTKIRGQPGCEMEVSGSHIGLVHNPAVMQILARHLDDAGRKAQRISRRRTHRRRLTNTADIPIQAPASVAAIATAPAPAPARLWNFVLNSRI